MGKEQPKELDDKWLPLFICSLFMLARINHDVYLADVKKRIGTRLRALGMAKNYSLDHLLLEHSR